MTQPAPATLAPLRRAAALDNLLVLAYSALLGLPATLTSPVLGRLLASYRGHHADHAAAFNAALVRMGGAAVADPEPSQLALVRGALPTLTTAAAIATLAARTEQVAVQAYVRDAAGVDAGSDTVRRLLVSVAAVEAQHATALLLTATGVGPRPDLATLPASLGAIACPGAFVPATAALPASR